ncbi:MAG: hypothetical protein JXL80_03570 [Planctomycetes bacterium]|nr:hypothetical protein [Planctomycetota bacterium]
MTDRSAEMILLAHEGDLSRKVRQAIPQAAVHDAPLEALADFAAAKTPIFAATMDRLGYRWREILGAARAACGEATLYVLGTPDQEAHMTACLAAGADDYMLWPFGLHDLQEAVRASRPAPTIPLPPAGRRPGELRLHTATASAVGTSSTTALRRVMRTLAQLADLPAPAIAAQGIEVLLEFDELAGAALVDASRAATPLAASGQAVDVPAVVGALSRIALPSDRWTRVEETTWLLPAAAREGAGLAVAVRLFDGPISAALLDELTTSCQVLMALCSAAKQREAAVRVLATDAETGLASRRYFEAYLAALFRRATEKRRELTVALLSPEGQAALQQATIVPLAALAAEHMKGGKLARLDERTIAIAMPGTGRDGTTAAQRLGDLARLIGEAGLPAPVAIGSATFPWHASDAASLLARARARLDESRDRNCRPVID